MFSLWDPLLVATAEHHPPFFNGLAEEILNRLILPQQLNPEDDEDSESLYMWLNHMLTSNTWKRPRKQSSLAYMTATCNGITNRWTTLLSEVLKTVSKENQVAEAPYTPRLHNETTRNETGYERASTDQNGDGLTIKVPGWHFAENLCRPLGAI
jgi:hypothetical protein